jgi:catechol 2,3-dioxygenase-like lactoylglutathione lyase family enzyme
MPTRNKTSKAPARRKAARPPAARRAARAKAPSALRLRDASPSFTVNDLEKSLAFYVDVLGFSVSERWEHDGELRGVEMKAGSVVFFIGQDDWKKGRDRVKGDGFRLYCSTSQDIDTLAAAIEARGGTLLEEPHDAEWGGRMLAVADPDGFKITIMNES